jgi:hypothetical protein
MAKRKSDGTGIMTQEKTVTIAGKEYIFTQKNMKDAQAWRELFQAKLVKWSDAFAKINGFEVKSGADLASLINVAGTLMVDLPSQVLDLLAEYDKTIKADKATIAESATDTDIIDAFVVAVKFAYPFGKLLTALKN